MSSSVDRIHYAVLDQAKQAFIAAGKRTQGFAEKFGFIPGARFGASANVFALDLKPFLKAGAEELFVTLLPEGLGTADDARPDDLTEEEARRFWRNIALKTLSTLTNDAASSGMQTILVSLYLPSAYPERVFTPAFMDGFLNGFVEGCETIGCVYFSGETPQLKTKFFEDKIDVAGALWGIVPAGRKPIDSRELKAGDTLVFIESTGPHENGFTTLRSLAERLPQGYRTQLPSGIEFWEAINAPGHLYTPFIQDVLEAGIQPSNVEPVTGHGWQKLMRSSTPLRYVIEQVLDLPEVFSFVEEAAGMSRETLLRTFNCGVGMAVYTHSREEGEKVVALAQARGWKACVAGYTEAADYREVVVKPWGITLSGDDFALGK